MGRVLRARDSRLGREVALKLLRPDLACDAACRARFEREARAVAALNHPNIVTVYAVEEDGDQHFLAMELVRGESLLGRIRPGGLPLADVRALALPVCEAVGAAHETGIVHCDLKPGNIMVDESGRVKVLDFGLARAVASRPAADPAEATAALEESLADAGGVFAGTLPYMSPEQLGGAPVTPASDVFSLGVLLFEMATGERPFGGPTPARVAAAILTEATPSFAGRGEAAETLAAVIGRCLEKDPARRFRNAGELRDALAAAGGNAVTLEEARAAFDRQEWRRAFERYRALEEAALSPDDLERHGDAAFWVGEVDDMLRLHERAFARHAGEGNRARAGLEAVLLAEAHYHRLAAAVSTGWLKRAERLLDDPETREHGYLLRFQTVLAIESERDFERALALADRVREIARRAGDADLEALAMQDRGRALVARGRVAEGMALLDEVMASAVGGELSPVVVGKSYCNMISSCHATADYRRAGEWSASSLDWCEAHPESIFPGLCRVYRTEVMRLRGAWADAEAEARRICGQAGLQAIAGSAYYEIGEIRLRQGDHADAEEAFRQAHQLGRDPMPGLAALRLAQGRVDAARGLLQRSLADASRAMLERIRLLPLRAEIGVAAGDLDDARAAAAELEELARPLGSPAFTATCEHARGLVLLADERAEEAVAALERGLRAWTAADMPYESARTRALLARAYVRSGNPDAAELEAAAARAVFRQLGATADLKAAEALPGGSGAA